MEAPGQSSVEELWREPGYGGPWAVFSRGAVEAPWLWRPLGSLHIGAVEAHPTLEYQKKTKQ